MLPTSEVVPFLVDADAVAGVDLPDKTDRKSTSHLLQGVTDSEQWVCQDSGDEGDNVNLSDEDMLVCTLPWAGFPATPFVRLP
jgi:hypothetical protein